MSLISPRFSDKKLFEFESLPTIIDRAHSKPLDLLFTLGPLGLITYYLFLYFILTSLWKRRRNELALACFLSIAGTSSALIFGFDTFVTHIFFWLISGVSLGLITIENSVKRPNLELIIKYILLLLTTVCLLISLMWILARAELEESEEQMALGNIVNSVSKGFDASAHFPFDRAILVQSAEKALVAHENTDNEQNREALNQFVENVLNKLEDLTKGQDGMVYIMRSWNAAIRAEDENVEMYISQALDKHPNYVLTYRIAIHSYDILGNSEKKKEMEQKILDILPSYWDDVESEQRRILLKENPWLEEIGLQ
ncbi:hypothetical protein KKG16_03660, partial [Patescibacteria group bacterium]|nr:hypothetical protein [Patescibacteria group bacterium]